jgi:hypothetical protein
MHVYSEIKLEFRNVDFYGGRKTRGLGERLSWQGREPTTQLNSHVVPELRIKPMTRWDHSSERLAYYCNATHAYTALHFNNYEISLL